MMYAYFVADENDKLPRRTIGMSERTWTNLGLIAVKTGRSKSEIVDEFVSAGLAAKWDEVFGQQMRQDNG